MYSMTTKRCRRHDNRHQKVNGTSDHHRGTKGDDSLLSQTSSNPPSYKSSRSTDYNKACQPRNVDYNGSISEGLYDWRRAKSVINSHQQSSDCHCG